MKPIFFLRRHIKVIWCISWVSKEICLRKPYSNFSFSMEHRKQSPYSFYLLSINNFRVVPSHFSNYPWPGKTDLEHYVSLMLQTFSIGLHQLVLCRFTPPGSKLWTCSRFSTHLREVQLLPCMNKGHQWQSLRHKSCRCCLSNGPQRLQVMSAPLLCRGHVWQQHFHSEAGRQSWVVGCYLEGLGSERNEMEWPQKAKRADGEMKTRKIQSTEVQSLHTSIVLTDDGSPTACWRLKKSEGSIPSTTTQMAMEETQENVFSLCVGGGVCPFIKIW